MTAFALISPRRFVSRTASYGEAIPMTGDQLVDIWARVPSSKTPSSSGSFWKRLRPSSS